MELITEPKVHLVSKTAVDWEVVALFLEEEGVPGVVRGCGVGSEGGGFRGW